MTKDEDFLDLSVTRGCPPKVVCLSIGNASNAATAILLLQQAETIERFCSHPEAGDFTARGGAGGDWSPGTWIRFYQHRNAADFLGCPHSGPWRATSSSISFSTAIRI